MYKEIWKDIEGYDGKYQISNLGRIKSFKQGKERMLKQAIDKNGYSKVVLWKNNKGKNYNVHRLVAIAFLSNQNNHKEVNHIDGNKQNNIYSNLEFVSHGENMKHAYIKGLNKKYFSKDNCHSKEVIQYNIQGQLIKTWGSTMDVYRELKLDPSSIGKCCRGKQKTAYGYKWKYKDIA